MAALWDLGISVRIGERPNEVPDPIRFSEDRTHAAYDPEYARRFWRILLQVDRVFKLFQLFMNSIAKPLDSNGSSATTATIVSSPSADMESKTDRWL